MPVPKYLPHYTLSDYRSWEGDWELWDGVAVSMSPSPFGRHQKWLAELTYRIIGHLKAAKCDDCEVLIECDWIIDEDTVLRPDLSIVCGTTTDGHIRVTPTLIIEVLSDGTRDKDRTAKRARYAAAGVRHYLMSDPKDGTTERLELDDQNRYQNRTGSIAPIELHTHCQLPADILATSN